MGAERARIGIIGAGAIGCVVGGLLARAGHDVTLVDPWPEHVEQIKAAGLRLSGSCGEHVVPIPALHLHELATVRVPFELVFVAVKSYDTEWATQLALDHLRRPDGVVVDFQNGINDHRVAHVAGRERTLGCVILISAGMYEAAHAIRTDRGSAAFKIGEHDASDSPRARRVAAITPSVTPRKIEITVLMAAAFAVVACGGGGGGGGSSSSTSSGGKKIALLLPETKTARYESKDRPYFTDKLKSLCSDCTVIYSNANQDAAQQQSQAEAALTNGANVLVLDEPYTALDAAGEELVDRELAEGRATVVCATHDPGRIEHLATARLAFG